MRTLAVRRCAPAFPFIRWRGNVFRPRRPVRPWRTEHSGRDASDPPRRGLGTGSGPGVFAHPAPEPFGSLPASDPSRKRVEHRFDAAEDPFADRPVPGKAEALAATGAGPQSRP